MESRRWLRLTILAAVVCASLSFFVWKGLRNWFQSSGYSRVVIGLSDDTKVYAVQQLRGHRRQIYLTLDPDGCRPGDPKTDYIFPNESFTVVVYKVTSDGLTIFSDMKPDQIERPSIPWARGNPSVVIATDPEIEDLVQNPTKFGVSVTDIANEELCWVNLFRVENSLGRMSGN